MNIGELNRFEDETIIDDNLLRKSSLANRKRKIKILGDGELEKRLIIKGLMTSKKAKEKIESKGGRVDYD